MKNKQLKIKPSSAAPYSKAHEKYLKRLRNDKIFVLSFQILILVLIIGLWELLAATNVIDPFFVSSPSRVFNMFISMVENGTIWRHIGITLLETLVGFAIATLGGTLIAILLWWNKRLRRILEPYIVVLNSLPKIALGPIIILWVGSGMSAIITMCVLICIVLTTISMLNAFNSCDADKIQLMKSMHANKFQIFWKLILPNATNEFISVLKINVGMSWVGTIMGEYLSSSAGLGYLIVYGSQIFNINLVMTSTVLLCILAAVMYLAICLIEKWHSR